MTEKESIIADSMPSGPYSPALRCGDFIFISGQLPVDRNTGEIPDDFGNAVECALDNLGALLAFAGASFADVVKTTVYLADMSDFARMNEIYGKRFPKPYPARTTVAARLPKNAPIEIDAIAIARRTK
jgi:2-iminobutanoate/2-iminopropanoate deaminase